MKKPFQPHIALICLAVLTAMTAQADPIQTQQLETVTVTGTAVPTRVNRQHLEHHEAPDLKQVMKNQIGMSVGGGNGVAQYYSIRGVGEDKINLEVDGTSQSTKIFHHQSRFQLDPALIKSINVEKGTGSASAGIGALGGTIRVTTVDAADLLRDDKPYGFRVGAGWSSNKGHHQNLAAYGRAYGFDGLVMANFLNNGDYKDGAGEVNTGSKLKQRSYLAKLGYQLNPDHRIQLSYRQEDQKGNRTDKAEFQTLSLSDGFLGYDGTEQKEESLNLSYKGRHVGFLDKIDANVFHIKTHDYKPPKGATAGKQAKDELEESTIKATGANLNLSSLLNQKHILKYGVNLREESSRSSDKGAWLKILELNSSNEKKRDYGAYVEGIWSFEPITLTTGLRYDYFKFDSASSNPATRSASHGQLNPSVGVIWDVSPHWSLLASYNQASRSPRLNEALLANERAGAAVDVDQNLKSETARRAELGFRWQQNGFNVAGSLFHQNIKDLIIYRWASIDNNAAKVKKRGAIYNSGSLKTTGFELDASYQKDGFKARVGVSQVNPRIRGDNLYYGESPVQDERQESSFYFWNTGRQWLTGLSYRFEHPKIEIGWLGRYAQKTPYADGARKKEFIRSTKAGYGVHDIYVNWQPLHDDALNVNFAVNNVGNKRYRSHSQRFPDGVGRIPYYERGREFTVGVNYRF